MMPAIAEVACICSLAGVSRSGYYHYPNTEEDRQHREWQDQKDFQRIVEAYQFRGYAKGARGIYMRLIHMDPPMVMNIKKIRRLMKKYGLKCPIRKANPYAVKTGKYIAVRPPGKERSVRLETLGNDYTEEAIRAHEPPPRRTAPRPAPKRSYKIQHKPRKLTGFRALYFHYLYLLGKLKKPTASP